MHYPAWLLVVAILLASDWAAAQLTGPAAAIERQRAIHVPPLKRPGATLSTTPTDAEQRPCVAWLRSGEST